MPKNICTLSDYNYLAKGLVMYESLQNFTPDFLLYYLCLDDKTFDKVKSIGDKELIPIHVDSITDPTLRTLREQEYKYFCWSLASSFTRHLMSKGVGDITYVDSDICFYDDFRIILGEIGGRDVGVFRHRQFNMDWDTPSGKFNVGVVHFKNTPTGKSTLNWWADSVLHKRYPELATCGDQKYLDQFLELGDRLYVDENIGHGSPWEWQLYDFNEWSSGGYIIWGGIKEKLIFSHFSQFEYDLKTDTYTPSTMHHCYTPLSMYKSVPALKHIYDTYFGDIKDVTERYSL